MHKLHQFYFVGSAKGETLVMEIALEMKLSYVNAIRNHVEPREIRNALDWLIYNLNIYVANTHEITIALLSMYS